MKGFFDKLIVGAVIGAAATLWIGSGYLIQRYLFGNRSPDGTTIIATSMGASVVAFLILVVLAKVLGYAN